MYNWIDKEYIKHYKKIAAVDEAGRGPLAGPVVAAAVYLSDRQERELIKILPFINDSKKLTEKKRNEIYDYVLENGISHSVGLSDATTIDKYNILVSTNMAMNNALKKLKKPYNMAIIDGKNLSVDYPNIQIIKGDSLSLRIALASNIAKVVRDKIMHGYAKKYPKFDFDKNKGYGTKRHMQALDLYGPTPFHRLTFKPLIDLLTKKRLLEWLESKQINQQRYEIILSKYQYSFLHQRHLAGFSYNQGGIYKDEGI